MSAIQDPPQYEEPDHGYSVQEPVTVAKRKRFCSSASLKMIAATLCIAGAVATCENINFTSWHSCNVSYNYIHLFLASKAKNLNLI